MPGASLTNTGILPERIKAASMSFRQVRDGQPDTPDDVY